VVATPPPSQNAGQNPGAKGSKAPEGPSANAEGIYVFQAEAREVILHATVTDDKNRLVTSLNKPDFTIFENDQPQTVQLFRREDFPVTR
jgi:Ca-activated chloride channel family protein